MYYFYMGSVLLPVAPERFTLKVNNANKTLTLINEGEINFLREAGLTDLKFEILIPATEYSFAMYEDGFKPPAYYLGHFEELKTSKKPFQFVVSRETPNGKLLFDTNMTVSIEDYTVEEKANEGFDLVVSINLKQYKPFGTKIIKVIDDPTTKQETTSTTETKVAVETVRDQTTAPVPLKKIPYVTKKGDTLWSITKNHYGDGSYYRLILDENGADIMDPYNIPEDTILVIPPLDAAAKMRLNPGFAGGGGSKISYKEVREER